MQINKFDALQTFYVDSSAVNSASEIYLTSIEVYFRKKPASNPSSGSIHKPGVILTLCEVENDIPQLTKVYDSSVSRVEYDSIYAFSDASIPTAFVFKKPLLVKTNSFYGFVIQFDDAGFELWSNKQGDKLVGTNNPSPGINSAKDGKYFNGAINTSVLNPLSNIDLKYKVNVAKFAANTLTVELVNKDYEFLTVNSSSGSFIGGEYVYKLGSNAQGTISVTTGNTILKGTNTLFNTLKAGSKLTVLTGNGGTVFTVSSVISNTELELTTTPFFTNTAASYISDVVGKVFKYDLVNKQLILFESTANSVSYLSNTDILVGSISKASAVLKSVDNYSIDRVIPSITITSPSIGTYSGTYNFSYSNGSSFVVDSSKQRNMATNQLNDVSKYDGYVLSRSNEVNNSFLYDPVARKSGIAKLTFNISSTTDKLFTAPSISEDEIDFFVQQSSINGNTYVLSNGVYYDSEVGKNGIADSRHITKKVTFANNRFAEDIRVFSDIYRPTGTEVKLYCRVHNSADPESFDDKEWTSLTLTENSGKYSSTENKADYIEYEYKLPAHSEVANTLPGTFRVESGNTVLIGSGLVVNTYITTGDLVKVYNPLEANTDYFITGVTSSNSTSATVNLPTSNASVLGTGFKIDKLKYKHTAFTDPQNDNVCTYFNSSFSKIDRFDTMQFKVVFLSNETYFIPRVNSLSVVGVSA